MIRFQVKDKNSQFQSIEVPQYVNLSLMEVLRAWEYPIAATCGGIAQCLTCHIVFVKGFDQLAEASDMEIDALDSLPDSDYKSRLACQIKVNEQLNGCLIEVRGSKRC